MTNVIVRQNHSISDVLLKLAERTERTDGTLRGHVADVPRADRDHVNVKKKKHKQCLSCHGLSLVQMMFSSVVTAVHLRQLHRTSTLVYFLTPSSVGATTLITFYGKCPGRYLHFAPLGRNGPYSPKGKMAAAYPPVV